LTCAETEYYGLDSWVWFYKDLWMGWCFMSFEYG